MAGTATSAKRRQVKRRRGFGSGAARSAICATSSRSSAGATGRAARSWVVRSSCDTECLLELAERPVEARRAVGGGDPEHPGGGAGVEVEDDAERDHLALAGRQLGD